MNLDKVVKVLSLWEEDKISTEVAGMMLEKVVNKGKSNNTKGKSFNLPPPPEAPPLQEICSSFRIRQ